MPSKGYHNLTVSDTLYQKLEKRSELEHRTIPEVIEHLLENSKLEHLLEKQRSKQCQ